MSKRLDSPVKERSRSTPEYDRENGSGPARMSLADMQTLAKLFFDSGMFKSVANVAQAFVKIKAGEEFGFGPFASMQAFNIIQGKVELSGDAQAHKLKASGKYDYRVTKLTDTECEIAFERVEYSETPLRDEQGRFRSRIRTEIGVSRFTLDDAKRAGLTKNDTWQKYPRNMLFNRALTNGVAWYCPDAMACRVYGEGEIGGEPPAPPKELQLTKDLDHFKVDLDTGEIVSEPSQEMPKIVVPPKITFTEKLKAREKVSTSPPAVQMATALKARQEGWDSDGHAKHPMDDAEEASPEELAKLSDAEQKMFATELTATKQWISQLHKERGPDETRALIEQCFGRKVTDLRETEKALRELSLGQLVDGLEALKQKRSERGK